MKREGSENPGSPSSRVFARLPNLFPLPAQSPIYSAPGVFPASLRLPHQAAGQDCGDLPGPRSSRDSLVRPAAHGGAAEIRDSPAKGGAPAPGRGQSAREAAARLRLAGPAAATSPAGLRALSHRTLAALRVTPSGPSTRPGCARVGRGRKSQCVQGESVGSPAGFPTDGIDSLIWGPIEAYCPLRFSTPPRNNSLQIHLKKSR